MLPIFSHFKIDLDHFKSNFWKLISIEKSIFAQSIDFRPIFIDFSRFNTHFCISVQLLLPIFQIFNKPFENEIDYRKIKSIFGLNKFKPNIASLKKVSITTDRFVCQGLHLRELFFSENSFLLLFFRLFLLM